MGFPAWTGRHRVQLDPGRRRAARLCIHGHTPTGDVATVVMVLFALAPLSALSLMTVMHAPAYFHLHLIWVWTLTLLVICTLGVAVARTLLQRMKTAPLV